MIEIEVTGGTKKQRQMALSLANYCVKKLMPRKRVLSIDIALRSISGESALGYCLKETRSDFSIEIEKRQSHRRLLETLAHELVHVKQYAQGELKGENCWMGKVVNPKNTDYWDLPWEIDAHGRECGLFCRWATWAGYADKPWAQDQRL